MPSREKLLQDLAPALMDGEEVIDLTTGMIPVRRMGSDTERNGTIAVTDRRIILFSKKLGGYDVQDFAFGLLSSVDHKRGLMYGNLDLAAAGDRTRIKMVPKDVERVAQAIRDKMAAAHAHSTAAPSAGADLPTHDPRAGQVAGRRADHCRGVRSEETPDPRVLTVPALLRKIRSPNKERGGRNATP